MNTILFDNSHREDLLPLVFTKPISELRIGILTFRERWEKILSQNCNSLTANYLQKKFPVKIENENLLINAAFFPDNILISEIENLDFHSILKKNDIFIAAKLPADRIRFFETQPLDNEKVIESQTQGFCVRYPWDIFSNNGKAIAFDFELLTKNRKSASLSATNRVKCAENIFLEEGAKVEFSILNAENSYIYIGKDAEIMEGCLIRGSLALCQGATLKMGAKIYGPTTVGIHSKIGGEVNNSVISGYSNKAHDGFLGNSVLGEWCNLGADTNNSNLKNNYLEVKVWNYVKKSFIPTGLQFCGLTMGDHSKSGINTMFNTGTVIGVSTNIFGDGFPRSFVPSFSWGGASGFTDYELAKAIETAKTVMKRRNIEFTNIDEEIFAYLYSK